MARGDLSRPATPRALGRFRGNRRFRAAVDRRPHGRFESIWEVLLAELHHAVGVEVEPQYEVIDDNGVWLARGDLWLVGTRRIHEYDDGHHRDPGQHHQDLRRDRRLGLAGWSRRGYTSPDLLRHAVHVLADADHALGRRHDPGRIRPWYAQLRTSLFSDTGRRQFLSSLPGTRNGHGEGLRQPG